ncbi:hypothetical protein PPG34_00665 [Candidatus Nitronereus thalassa]|uniref:Uncharacterized protein n=1 Tax=Candidatus Nitronereus thalassa TaxID=3020898 RepID=A0ABU3K396_9BACT|nr:hypothetical protein [Candidatus Nitronereus thalassa]MDT7040839.1 hypothetical protein [Candidatus Nitronereus thalassa]
MTRPILSPSSRSIDGHFSVDHILHVDTQPSGQTIQDNDHIRQFFTGLFMLVIDTQTTQQLCHFFIGPNSDAQIAAGLPKRFERPL